MLLSTDLEVRSDKDLALTAAKLIAIPRLGSEPRPRAAGGVHCLRTVDSSKAWTGIVTNYVGVSKANLLDSLGYLLRTGDWQLVLIESNFLDEFYGLEVDPDWVEFQRAALTLKSSNV